MNIRHLALTGVAIAALSTPATAQSVAQPVQPEVAEAPAVDDLDAEEEIVVTGARPRGSVIGDIPPQNVLNSRDIRATGASSVEEILEALAPQIGSGQGRSGGRPITLINGQRISSFRELRDVPPEAIQRMEILPEEVALKYGYRADQKVVNIVLRERFRSTTAQAGTRIATEGGYLGGNVDLTQFSVQRNGRTTMNAHVEGNGMLTEGERNILIDPDQSATADQQLAARSLLPTKRDVRLSGTMNRQLGTVGATFNAEVEHRDGRALVGLGDTLLVPLARNTSTDSSHGGIALNGTKGDWRWALTGNADVQQDVTRTERDDAPGDRSRQTLVSGDFKGTANGKLFTLPAGNASTTLTIGGSTLHLDSERQRLGVASSQSLGRTTGEAAVNVDLPISRRGRDFSALGNLTLSANAGVDQISDFGTLTTIGAGANWSPVDRLNLITSWSREEGAPSINQLGDPVLETPGTRIFDFTTGGTALVTATTGGNPDLLADRRTVWKLGGNWQPSEKTDLRLRAEYVRQTVDRPIAGLAVTPTLEAAFPERFVRNGAGELISVDLRPVNFDSSERQTLRFGFDFTKPLASRRPSQALVEQLRGQFGGARRPGGAEGAAPTAGADRQGARGAGAGGRGGGFGGRNGGRLTFSLTDTLTFVDKVIIGPGLAEIDYLGGDAAGQSGGTPRHNVEARAGYFNNGLGARLSANWRSGTTVDTLAGDELRFSPLSTFDLRLFANVGQIPEVVVKHPWLRGSQVTLQVDNVFNSRPNVRNGAGAVPLNYQPGLLDPLGRTVMISFRKLFLPARSFFRNERGQGQSR
ncbi:MAG TPA: TonB-dependent receptor [Sphingomicrobium sp.]|jgi:hypothetical protein